MDRSGPNLPQVLSAFVAVCFAGLSIVAAVTPFA